MKRALITGVNGQDGSYLAEYLLSLGYDVHGTVRSNNLQNLKSIQNNIRLHNCDLANFEAMKKVVTEVKPDECYHLAGSSFVNYTFSDESSVMTTNFNATHFLLTTLKEKAPHCRLYFAGSSEMFGNCESAPQDEKTPFSPRSIYGISKVASHLMLKNERAETGFYACTGLTYNHESPRRGSHFVTQRIAHGVADVAKGRLDKISLGNIEAVRDWGYAPEYVRAMHAMLQNPHGPRDYVIATGKTHSVRDFLKIAFETIGRTFSDHITEDPRFFRPSEKVPLVGNATLIKKELGWQPSKDFESMVTEMVEAAINTSH